MMRNEKYDVVVIGELNIDLILNKLAQFPEVGKDILAEDMAFTLGSSSAIFASNLSVLGSEVSFIGELGEDMFGNFILSSLQEKNLHTEDIIFAKHASTGITVAFNFGEDRAMVTYPGAMNELCMNDIQENALKKAKHLHVSNIFMQLGLKQDVVSLFKKAKELGLTTSLDTQWDPSEKWDLPWKELLRYVDVFIPNKSEIQNMANTSSLDKAIDYFKDNANVIVVKDGSKGAHLFHKEEFKFQEAFKVTHVVDSIGAGDSFDAGFIYQYVCGSSLEKCLEFGALTGAMNTMKAGGTGAFQNKEDFKRLAKEIFSYHVD